MSRTLLKQFTAEKGYASDLDETAPSGFLTDGTENALPKGVTSYVPFGGITLDEAKGIAAKHHFLVDDSYAGLGGVGQVGKGTIWKAFDLLLFSGDGDVIVKGVDTTRSASDVLSYIKRDDDGNFTSESIYGQVGHPRPSKPDVYVKSPPSVGITPMNSVVSVAIHAADSITGQTSVMSEVSDPIEVINGSVIIAFPEFNTANNQDIFGVDVSREGLANLGNLYQLPTELNGEVTYEDLEEFRTINLMTIPIGTDDLTVDDTSLTGNDVGRIVVIGAYRSWITEVLTSSTAKLNDIHGTGVADEGIIKQGIDGYERAIEISWSDYDLMDSDLAPTEAFVPPLGKFSGGFLDVVWIEDLEGTIFFGLPQTLGSFPKDRRILTHEKAIAYIPETEGSAWRFCKQEVGSLFYTAGETSIVYEQRVKGMGIDFPQNACGTNTGVIFWNKKRPVKIINGSGVDDRFGDFVASEFEGWDQQTVDKPVVVAHDPIGFYDVFCFGAKVMAYHTASGRWSSPLYITGVPPGSNIVSQVLIENELYLVVDTGDDIAYYKFNSGDDATTMTLVTQHYESPNANLNITMIDAIIDVDNDSGLHSFSVIKDFLFGDEIPFGEYTPEYTGGRRHSVLMKETALNCASVAVKVVVSDAEMNSSIHNIKIYGFYNPKN